jgi:hypothetical protein
LSTTEIDATDVCGGFATLLAEQATIVRLTITKVTIRMGGVLLNERFGGSTGVALGGAEHGSLVALRRRLSPGLPLSRTPLLAPEGAMARRSGRSCRCGGDVFVPY